MSQHQQAFLADNVNEVDRVAHHVLAVLAKGAISVPQSVQSHNNFQENTPNFRSLDKIVDHLYEASISQDRCELARARQGLRADGICEQTLLIDVVPRVARQLGKAWESDSLSFGAVTIGCARLQTLVLQLDETAAENGRKTDQRVLECLVVVPENAQHTLGAIVLSKQLRRAGHNVRLNLGGTPLAQSKLVQSHLFDAIMISASKSEEPETVQALVAASRAKGAKTKVFIGGSILDQHRDLVEKTGADYVRDTCDAALDLCLGRTSGLKEP